MGDSWELRLSQRMTQVRLRDRFRYVETGGTEIYIMVVTGLLASGTGNFHLFHQIIYHKASCLLYLALEL